MIIYSLRSKLYKEGESLPYSLTIDPGLVTSGFCLLDTRSGSIILRTILNNENYISSTFLENYVMCASQFKLYIKTIQELLPDVPLSLVQVNVEHSVYNPEFQFSIGLNMFLTYLVDHLSSLGVVRVDLIPPRTPQFFLQTREKLKLSQIKKWVKYFLPMFYEVCDSAHSIDALLHSVFLHYDIYTKHHKIDVRVPDLEIRVKDL